MTGNFDVRDFSNKVLAWKVLQKPTFDGKSFLMNFDTSVLQQGDSGIFSVAIENVTPFDMDSLDFLIKDIKVNLIKGQSINK